VQTVHVSYAWGPSLWVASRCMAESLAREALVRPQLPCSSESKESDPRACCRGGASSQPPAGYGAAADACGNEEDHGEQVSISFVSKCRGMA
jgi:hypothetical protein